MTQEDLLDQVECHGCAMTMRDNIAIFRLILSYVFRDVQTGRRILEELLNYLPFNSNTGLVAFLAYRQTGMRKYLKMANATLDFFTHSSPCCKPKRVRPRNRTTMPFVCDRVLVFPTLPPWPMKVRQDMFEAISFETKNMVPFTWPKLWKCIKIGGRCQGRLAGTRIS